MESGINARAIDFAKFGAVDVAQVARMEVWRHMRSGGKPAADVGCPPRSGEVSPLDLGGAASACAAAPHDPGRARHDRPLPLGPITRSS
jgi:hypothetical protein